MGQGMSAAQFFLYGKKHFTQTGYVNHVAKYAKEEAPNLTGKVFVVTGPSPFQNHPDPFIPLLFILNRNQHAGSNSGVGREIAQFLFRQNGRVYMVCRDAARAAQARTEILADASGRGEDLVSVIADCSLRADILKVSQTLGKLEPGGVDALVCNAGALLSERTLTTEGVETTFACHLLYGAYGLAKVQPCLRYSGLLRILIY